MGSGGEIHRSRNRIVICIKSNTVERIGNVTCILTGLGHAFTLNLGALVGARCAACTVTGGAAAGRGTSATAAAYSNVKLIHICPTTALIAFYGKCCLVHETHLHSHALPSLEMLGYGNGTAGTLRCTHAPVLLEGGITVDGRLIYTSGLVYIIGTAVYGDGSLGGCPRRTPGSPAVYNVILHQRLSAPSVYTEVRITVRLIVHTVIYRNVTKLGVSLRTIPLYTFTE